MKKTALLAVALATCLGYVPAQAAEVVSSNIVGYSKISLKPGLNMVSSQFVMVGAGETPLGLTEATNLEGQASFDEDGNAQTTIRFWTGGGYDYYDWSGDLTGENPDFAEELADELEVDASTLNNHWLNGDYEIAEEELTNGQGFWIYASNAGSLTFSGQVPALTNTTFRLVAGLNIVSCPWPMAQSLQKIVVGGQPSFDEDGNAQTTLRVWTGGGYDYFDWSGDLTGENPDFAEELADELEVDASTLNNHWLNGDYEVADDAIALGTSFWIYAKNAGTITFLK